MKYYIYCILCLSLISCASRNYEKQVIRDFIKEETAGKYYYSVLVEEAFPRMLPLENYEKAFLDRKIPLETHKVRMVPFNNRHSPQWPIDSLEISNLKEKYSKDTITYHWKKKDFIRPQFKIFKKKEILFTNSAIRQKYNLRNALLISKPIISSDKKFALFFKSSYIVGFFYGQESKTVLMENVNGTWKTINTYVLP
jgi:hypothetical protein